MAVDKNSLRELYEVIGDDYEGMLELVDSFVSDAPDLIAGMTEGLKADDSVVVARSAHTMKSSSRDFGLLELADLCFELETISKAGELERVGDLIQRIERLYESERSVLLEAIGELKI